MEAGLDYTEIVRGLIYLPSFLIIVKSFMEEFDVAIGFDVSIFQLFFYELWLINLEIVFWSSNELITTKISNSKPN